MVTGKERPEKIRGLIAPEDISLMGGKTSAGPSDNHKGEGTGIN